MALGNSNSSAQSRGKNKAVVVKRRKEVVLAADYKAFSTGAVKTDVINSCNISTGSMTTEYFHDGSHGSNLPFKLVIKFILEKELTQGFTYQMDFTK